MRKEALFLDRDGTINEMVYYPERGMYDQPLAVEDVKLLEGIVDIIAWANQRHIPVIEITNQPGVAKGKMDMSLLDSIEARIHQLLGLGGVRIDRVYRCFHHPEAVVANLKAACDCRKPKPGMLLQAATEFQIDLARSCFVGDNATDVQAGKAAGCKTAILTHRMNLAEKTEAVYNCAADYRFTSWPEVRPRLSEIFVVT